MPKLSIHLNEGFNKEDVEVRLNGVSLARLTGVTTNYSSGLARTVEAEAPAGPCLVELIVPGAEVSRAELTLDSDTFLKVRKEGTQLVLKPSTIPPVYF